MMMLSDKFFENKIKVVLALLLPAFFIYLKSLQYDFTTLDEQWMIVKNGDLDHPMKALVDGFSRCIANVYYRPLLIASFVFDFCFGKRGPFMYHLSNLLWHLAAVWLLFRFLCLNGVSKKTAFIYALIFSLHPVLLHAIAWVPGRNDIMLCVFALASLNCLLRFINTPQLKFVWWHLLFYLLALLTKENAIVLTFIFLAFYVMQQPARSKRLAMLCSAWLLISVGWYVLRSWYVFAPADTNVELGTSIKNFFPAMLLYLGKSLLPVQQSIWPSLNNSSIVPGIIVLLLLPVLWFRPGVKNWKLAAMGLFIFFVFLIIPVWYSVIKGSSEQYEHRMYTSMAGMLLFVSQLKLNVSSKNFYYAAGCIAIVFAIKTFMRMPIYKNKDNFVNAGVKECPDFYLFTFQKAENLFAEKKYDSALVYCNKAIAMRPDKEQIYANRGSVYYFLHRCNDAIKDFDKAIALGHSFDYRYHLNRCISLMSCNDPERAMKDLYLLRKKCADVIPAHLDKDVVTKWTQVMNDLDGMLAKDSTNAALHYQRGSMLLDVDKEQEGLRELAAACRLAPGNKDYLNFYMAHYEQSKKAAEKK